MTMKKYRFLIAWIAESDGAAGEDTKVRKQADLVPQYEANNPHVTSFEYDAPEEFDWDIGAAMAFEENWTAQDSVSVVVPIE